jgi:hypothetical protein
MTRESDVATITAWEIIDVERRRDRILWQISACGWVVTLLVVILFGALTAWRVAGVLADVSKGAVPSTAVVAPLIPFVAAVGVVGLLVATLATIGAFVRFRAASLSEIQLRLGALERMLTEQAHT